MNWIKLKRNKILIKGKQSKLNLKGIKEEHTAFLQGILTNNVAQLNDKEFNYNLMLDHKGSPIWDFYVFKDNENYILDFEFDRDEVLNKLKQLKLSYQVFFEVLEFEHIYIFGEDSEKFIQQTFNEVPEKFKYLKSENIYIANNPLRLGQKGFDIFGDLESIKSNLPTDLKIDEEEFENLRINNCIPKIGKELVEKVLPLETNIWKYAISLNKGCYVGQEAIARVYFRGKPPRVMVKFSFDNILNENEKVLLNDKPVGFITSVNIKDKTAIGFILRNMAESSKELKSSQSVLKILNICQELNVWKGNFRKYLRVDNSFGF